MRQRASRMLLCAATPVVVAALAIAWPLATSSQAVEDPNRRDDYGLKPDDGSDKELSLPDPVLDRGWPAPPRGEDTAPPRVAPDEDEIDPFKDEDAPPRPPDKRQPPVEGEPPVQREQRPAMEDKPKPAPRPLVSPDGRVDPGSPAHVPDPIRPDILEPEINEPSEIDDEDNAPSPLDRGDTDFDNETNDPGDW